MKKTPILVTAALIIFSSGVIAENLDYTIRKGDTLYSISRKYKVSVEVLKDFNKIDDPSKLFPGMTLSIPDMATYTVKKGDTYFGIARKHDLSLESLLELNNLVEPDTLMPGQQLNVTSAIAVNQNELGEAEPIDGAAAENNDSDAVADASAAVEESTNAGQPDSGDRGSYWPHYGSRVSLTGKLRGIQIKGKPGDEIKSVARGTVVWASEYGIYKQLVLVESTNGIVYGYGGNERTSVTVGDSVKAGSVIGLLGGNENESTAYFFIYKDGKPLDPEKAPRV